MKRVTNSLCSCMATLTRSICTVKSHRKSIRMRSLWVSVSRTIPKNPRASLASARKKSQTDSRLSSQVSKRKRNEKSQWWRTTGALSSRTFSKRNTRPCLSNSSQSTSHLGCKINRKYFFAFSFFLWKTTHLKYLYELFSIPFSATEVLKFSKKSSRTNWS